MELAEFARVDSTNSRQMFYWTRVFYCSPRLWITLLINLRAMEWLAGQWRPVFHMFFIGQL